MSCIFCKIIKGEIPSMKVYESAKIFAFLDINPLSRGHILIIPKHHAAKLTDVPDDSLQEILPVTKQIAKALNEVDHVHFHLIPKPDQAQGLGIEWPQQKGDMEALKTLCEEMKSKM